MVITAHLMGGLGNQLFQIFATIAYSFTNKIPFTFPRLKNSREAQYRQTVYWDNFLSNLSKFTYKGIKPLQIYRERKFTYEELPTKNIPQQGFKLFGYFPKIGCTIIVSFYRCMYGGAVFYIDMELSNNIC